MNDLFLALFLLSLAGLVIGLIRPQLVKMPSRKKATQVFAGATAFFFILFGITMPSQPATVADTATTTPQAVSTSNMPAKADTAANKPSRAQAAPATVVTQTQKPTASAPAPTSAPAPAPTTNSETVSQENAVRKAISYLNYSAFSHDGLVAQLEYDQFSPADAVYGADNSGADWNEQAAAKAKSYMSYSAFSRGSLIAQLEYDKFTQTQAEYGASAVGL